MTTSKWTLLVFIFILFFTVSCGNKVEDVSTVIPETDIPKEQINTEIVLFDNPGFANSYKNGSLLGLGIKNQSKQTIVFPSDYGIRIFTKQGKGWDQVENAFHYPQSDVKLPTQKIDPTGLVIDVVPWIPDLKEKQDIRIIIIGYVEGNSTKQVAAYIDVQINP